MTQLLSVKNCLYLNKRARHSAILDALTIPKIEGLIQNQRIGLLQRVFNVDTLYTSFCKAMITEYLSTGLVPENTLVGNIINMGISPVSAIFTGVSKPVSDVLNNNEGYVDSVRTVLNGEYGQLKPGSTAHKLLMGLTKSFETNLPL